MARIATVVTAVFALAAEALPQATPAGEGCTTTLTVTETPMPTPPYWRACSFDGTARIYSSTVTMSHGVNCHGCHRVSVSYEPPVHCPANIFKATRTESTPYTIHTTVCAASTGY
ncbi:uncharacterized protein MAM_03022 [Metarhizium album ARSEF 1941]|uniref:Uncharacterized protein n=1 Tax=Metarhizium album (strain ARSEF 1941) TaxID=1081103 RepID=A0A0B2X0F7_METAS|nr:uncharacterized protein MAM_03022 [Metarhizium album ARSEF 1941]KHN99324.1 hypothetical protein MAM_03022 [Metarhizium album ARSEF 1941]